MSRFDTLIGPISRASDPEARAAAVLDSLKYGMSMDGCARLQVDATSWGRIQVMPGTTVDDAPPFEVLLCSLAGTTYRLEVIVRRVSGEFEILVGAVSGAELERIRRVLAPGVIIAPSPPPPVVSGHCVGVIHRVEPAPVTQQASIPKGRQTFLDKVMTLDGDSQVVMHFESPTFEDVLATRFALGRVAEDAAAHASQTHSVTQTQSRTVVSYRWDRVSQWLGTIDAMVAEGEGVGLWTVDTWVCAPGRADALRAAGALHASIPGSQGRWYATRDLHVLDAERHPPTSVLTSRDVGALLSPPRVSGPGLSVRPSPPAARRPAPRGAAIRLGSFSGTAMAASVAVQDLEGHAFVTGTTGSGKTTTLHRMLAGLWNDHHIPFLVVDPVKDDYSSASGAFDGGIRVVRGNDLHMDILEPWFGSDRRAHVTRIADAFRGAFSMPSPTPYVVTQLFDRLSMLPGGGKGVSLFDLRDMVGPLVTSLGYAPEQEANIRAILMTRLNLLLAPNRAHRFAWSGSQMLSALFEVPTVVTLSDLGDEEERSFLVILLALAAASRARSRHRSSRSPQRSVDHVLVLEEAHRIIPEVDQSRNDPEFGSAAQVSSQLLSSMLAEVRAYGEQIIVVDQSPSRVSSEVIRNTNLKVVHRVVHPYDQVTMAGSLGVPEDRATLLGALARGQVICTTRSEPSAQTIDVDRIRTDRGQSAASLAVPPSNWPCTGDKVRHFRAWQAGRSAAVPMSYFLAAVMWGDGDGRKARQAVYRHLLEVGEGDQVITDCLAWSGLRSLLARRREFGPTSGPFSVDEFHSALYGAWAAQLPLTTLALEGFVTVPRQDPNLTGVEALTWEERAMASALLDVEPRNGLAALRGPGWRGALADTGAYLRSRHSDLEPVLGTGAKMLLADVVHVAVHRLALSPDIGDELILRGGLT